MNNIDLESLLIDLLSNDDYGEDYFDKEKAPKRQLKFSARRAAFVTLVGIIRDRGEDRSYFSPSIKRTICTYFMSKNSKKFKSWYDMSSKDLDFAISRVFASDKPSTPVSSISTRPVDHQQTQQPSEETLTRKPKLDIEVLKPDDLKHPMPPINKREVSTEPELDRLLGLTKDDE